MAPLRPDEESEPDLQEALLETVGRRSPLSDEEFARRLNVPQGLHRFAIAAREALGRTYHVPASSFYPEDAPKAIGKLQRWNKDHYSVILQLEHILGVSIPEDEELPRLLGWRFFWGGNPKPKTIGEWAVQVAKHLQSTHGEIQKPFLLYSIVRVKKLLRRPDEYNGWSMNKRNPEIGDIGIVMGRFEAKDLPNQYIVERSESDGSPTWLAELAEEELEPM
jgi:hypothetical protein